MSLLAEQVDQMSHGSMLLKLIGQAQTAPVILSEQDKKAFLKSYKQDSSLLSGFITFKSVNLEELTDIIKSESKRSTKEERELIASLAIKLGDMFKVSPLTFVLMWYFESHLSFRADNNATEDKRTVAYGLNQIHYTTLKNWKKDMTWFKTLSPTAQAEYVVKYYSDLLGIWNKTNRSFEAMYMINWIPTLAPEVATMQPETLIRYGTTSAQVVRNWNKGFDLNNDGVITFNEFRQFIRKNMPPKFRQFLASSDSGDILDYSYNLVALKFTSIQGYKTSSMYVPLSTIFGCSTSSVIQPQLRQGIQDAVLRIINSRTAISGLTHNKDLVENINFPGSIPDGSLQSNRFNVTVTIRRMWLPVITLFSLSSSGEAFIREYLNQIMLSGNTCNFFFSPIKLKNKW